MGDGDGLPALNGDVAPALNVASRALDDLAAGHPDRLAVVDLDVTDDEQGIIRAISDVDGVVDGLAEFEPDAPVKVEQTVPGQGFNLDRLDNIVKGKLESAA